MAQTQLIDNLLEFFLTNKSSINVIGLKNLITLVCPEVDCQMGKALRSLPPSRSRVCVGVP